MSDLARLIQQCRSDTRRWFPEKVDDINHQALGLGGEVGEVLNLLKKVDRGDMPLEEVRKHLSEELVDVMIYLFTIFGILGVDPTTVYELKRAHNERRFGSNAQSLSDH